MKPRSDSAKGRIISLTYHEITQDPRVLKEARALRAAGHDVEILCDWPADLPEKDAIDGIAITRFRCFGMDDVTTAAFHEMTFLDRSRDVLARRYLPYAEACEIIRKLRPWLEEQFGPQVFKRMESSWYKRHKGRQRLVRRLSYLWLSFRLRFAIVHRPEGSSLGVARSLRRKLKQAHQALKATQRELFQAQSVVFWSNLRVLDIPGPVAAVHAHDIYCLPAGVMLAQRFGVPLVYDAHEYEPARATKIDSEATDLPLHIEDDCFPHVDRMITVSDGIGDLYAKRYPGPRPTIVMNAPEIMEAGLADTVRLRPGFRTVRDRVGLPEDVPLVIFTGGIQREHRGMDKVLEALVHMPGVHLANMGPRHSANDDWFLALARRLGVADRVTLLDPVDARDVPAAISTATIAVCPIQDASLSYRFSLPNKLFEAAFAGLPVCVSDLPEMRRFVETLGIGRAMDQTDPRVIAEALLDVIGNRAAYRPTPEAAAKLEAIYSWPAQAAKLVSLYEDLLDMNAAWSDALGRAADRSEA